MLVPLSVLPKVGIKWHGPRTTDSANSPSRAAGSWSPTAAQLTRTSPLPLRFFGRDFALYRGKSGKPVLLDAYCPHMGTHLAPTPPPTWCATGTSRATRSAAPTTAGASAPTASATTSRLRGADPQGCLRAQLAGGREPGRRSACGTTRRAGSRSGRPRRCRNGPTRPGFTGSSITWAPCRSTGRKSSTTSPTAALRPDPRLDRVKYFENEFNGHVAVQRMVGRTARWWTGEPLLRTDTTYHGPGLSCSRTWLAAIPPSSSSPTRRSRMA